MPCMYAAAQVLVTGARTATLLQRLPFLPAADAYVCENGGRIFYPDMTLPTACQIAEDARWRARHTPTGALLALHQCARLVVVHLWMSHSGGQAGPARPRQWVHARVSGAAQRHRCGGGCCKPTGMPWRGGDGQLQREASESSHTVVCKNGFCARCGSGRALAGGPPSSGAQGRALGRDARAAEAGLGARHLLLLDVLQARMPRGLFKLLPWGPDRTKFRKCWHCCNTCCAN